jgi:hypothetical protein
MRSVEINSLRKHILKELYNKLPFYIVSSGIRLGVVVSPREYNRLKLIEYASKKREEYNTRMDKFVSTVHWHNEAISPEE